MKNLFYFFFIALLGSSCSKPDDILPDKDENDFPESVKIRLNVEKKQGNIFELMTFSLFSETDFSLLDLTETYDSIVWKVSDIPGSFKILEHKNNENHFTSKWSHNFFLPGDLKTYLFGYKDNKIICADTVFVNISNQKDFLIYDWTDISASSPISTGYEDKLSKGYSFSSNYSIDENVPSIKLFLRNENRENEISFAEKSEKILSDYICALYSPPVYNKNDDSFLSKYDQLFKCKKNNTYPQSIWTTSSSNIVLLKCYDKSRDYYTYEIHAEQRNLSVNSAPIN